MPVEATFSALADPSRRGVIDLLRRKPRRAGELATELGLTAPAMSRHLRILRDTGLVERAFDGIRHRELTRPELVARIAGEGAVRSEPVPRAHGEAHSTTRGNLLP